MSPPFDGAAGRRETRSVKAQKPDLDVMKARRLAGLLTALADKLERPRAELEEGIDPERYDVKTQVDASLASARETIGRLHDTWTGVDSKHTPTLASQRRGALLSACLQASTLLTLKVPAGSKRSSSEDGAVDLALEIYSTDLPEHAALARASRVLVRDVLRAHARAKGAPKLAEAIESLCDAMGFPADYDSVKKSDQRARRRAKKRVKPRPG